MDGWMVWTKKQQRHRQGHLIQAHIPPLSNCKDTGEEPSSLHNSKHTKHAHATLVQNTAFYSDGTTHTKQHRSKRVQPNGSPCANNHCSTRYEQSFRHNKHTHTNQKAADIQTFQAQSLSSSRTISRDAKPTQHIEITHPNNVNLKLAFHKVASFHPHYSTFTPQDHLPPPSAPVQVMAYADDITITSTHTSTSAAKKYIQPYLHKVFAWTKQNNLLLNPDKTT